MNDKRKACIVTKIYFFSFNIMKVCFFIKPFLNFFITILVKKKLMLCYYKSTHNFSPTSSHQSKKKRRGGGGMKVINFSYNFEYNGIFKKDK